MSFILQPWHLMFFVFAGWANREQQIVIESIPRALSRRTLPSGVRGQQEGFRDSVGERERSANLACVVVSYSPPDDPEDICRRVVDQRLQLQHAVLAGVEKSTPLCVVGGAGPADNFT